MEAPSPRRLSWDWAACLATFAWLKYNRRRAWSWLYLFVSTPVLLGVVLLSTVAGDACERALAPAPLIPTPLIAAALALLGFIVPPLFADRLRRDPALAPSKGGAAVAVVLHLVVLAAIVSLVNYADYRYRSRVDSIVGLLSNIQIPLTEHYLDRGQLPATLAELGVDTSDPLLERMELAPDGTVRAVFGIQGGRLAGHSVALAPIHRGEQIYGWSCASEDLPDVCLPSGCRAP